MVITSLLLVLDGPKMSSVEMLLNMTVAKLDAPSVEELNGDTSSLVLEELGSTSSIGLDMSKAEAEVVNVVEASSVVLSDRTTREELVGASELEELVAISLEAEYELLSAVIKAVAKVVVSLNSVVESTVVNDSALTLSVEVVRDASEDSKT